VIKSIELDEESTGFDEGGERIPSDFVLESFFKGGAAGLEVFLNDDRWPLVTSLSDRMLSPRSEPVL
jgi:hypothetical protein